MPFASVSTEPFVVVPVLVGGAANAAEANASESAATSADVVFMLSPVSANGLHDVGRMRTRSIPLLLRAIFLNRARNNSGGKRWSILSQHAERLRRVSAGSRRHRR